MNGGFKLVWGLRAAPARIRRQAVFPWLASPRCRPFAQRRLEKQVAVIAALAAMCGPSALTLQAQETDFVREPLGRVETLPAEPGPHWIWVSDMVWTAMPDGRATLVDADRGTVLGLLSTGYSFNTLTLPRTPGLIYSAETYYSRYTRGERTDVVTVYDWRNLAPIDEIEIPPKRMSTTPKLSTAALTDDDRFMIVYNFTPVQSHSVVDVQERRFVEEVPSSGCALVYPTGERSFLSLCADGTVQHTRLDEEGSAQAVVRSAVFFDPAEDPLLEKGVRPSVRPGPPGSNGGANPRRPAGLWLFPSYEGDIYEVAVAADGGAAGQKAWSLVNAEDRRASWRIGGIQPLALHTTKDELYALMHQGGKDTHHQPGTEVWVFDLAQRQRKARIALVRPATSIQVSQDEAPLLYAVNPDAAQLEVYRAASGEHLQAIGEISITPSLLQLPQ